MIPDYIITAEQQIIGGILRFGDGEEFVQLALAQLVPADFALAEHQGWFRTLVDMGGKADLVGFAKQAGNVSVETVAALMECTFTTANFSHLIGIIKEAAMGRRVRQRMLDAMDSDTILDDLERLVAEERGNCPRGEYTLEGAGLAFVNDIGKPLDRAGRIWTNFPRLDGYLGGLRKQTVSMVGARPSTGKTAFALNIVRHQIHNGKRTLLLSLEMSVQQIMERLCADWCDISYGKISNRTLTPAEADKITSGVNGLVAQGGLHIVDDVYTIEGMGKVIASVRPEFVVIDFIQIVSTMQRFASRRNEIDFISQQIKRLAKQYDCHIMTLSQLTRDGANEPKMSDLKESGALEQDNDYILLLHRPYVVDKKSGVAPEEAGVLLDKNKYGKTGVVPLRFWGDHQRFCEAGK